MASRARGRRGRGGGRSSHRMSPQHCVLDSRPRPSLSSLVMWAAPNIAAGSSAPGSAPATWVDHAICSASRQVRFRKWRSSFFTGWSRVPLAPGNRKRTGRAGAELGDPNRTAPRVRLSLRSAADAAPANSGALGLPADVREQGPRLLLAGPSDHPGADLRAGRRRRRLARDRSRAGRRDHRPPLHRRHRHLDADRVLASSPRSSTGSRSSAAAIASTSSSTASITTTRTTPCGW